MKKNQNRIVEDLFFYCTTKPTTKHTTTKKDFFLFFFFFFFSRVVRPPFSLFSFPSLLPKMSFSETLRSTLGVSHPSLILSALLIHLNIFFYALSFWVQQPSLPFLSKKIGSDEVMWGYQQSLGSFFALVGGPMMGRMVDTQGAKRALILSQFGSAIQYLFVGCATSVHFLFLAAIPCSVQHAMLCAQAAVSALSRGEERAKALGGLSLSYGLGMVVGSYFGGVLGDLMGEQNAALVAAGVSGVVIVVDVVVLPPLYPPKEEGEEEEGKETKKEEKKKKKKKNQKEKNLFSPLQPMIQLLRNPSVRALIIFSTLLSTGISAYKAMNALVLKELYSITPSQLGQLMSFSALIALLTNILLVPLLSPRLGDLPLTYISSTFLSLTYLTFSHPWEDFSLFLLFLIPNIISSTLLYTTSGAILSKIVQKKQLGTSLSLSHACRSLTGMVAPVVGGYIFKHFQSFGLAYFASFSAGIGTIYLFVVGGVVKGALEKREVEGKEKKGKGE